MRRRLDDLEFRCVACKKVHRRSVWSIAHMHIEQTFDCDCGVRTVLLLGRKRTLTPPYER